jgi:hypothetical protein
MPISLEHDRLKADLAAAQNALGVRVEKSETNMPSITGRNARERVVCVTLPKSSNINARFVREGLLERAKKWIVDEVEVGSAIFDDLIYIITNTREATSALLMHPRVQQALLLLVDETRHVEIEGEQLRVVDDYAPDDGKDALAEALAIAAHLV